MLILDETCETVQPLKGYSPEKKFYVYLHKRKDGSVFYVGKGHGNRAHVSKARNNHWQNVVNKNGGFDVEIIHTGLDEQTAFRLEAETIALYGMGNLTNQTLGGISTTGMRHTSETRDKQSAIVKEKLKENPERYAAMMARMQKLSESQDSSFREAAIAAAHKRVSEMTPEEREEYIYRKTRWLDDPDKKATAIAKASIKRNTAEYKAKASAKMKEYWEDEEYRAKKAESSARQWDNPEFKAMLRKIRSQPIIVNRSVYFDCIKDFENQCNNGTSIGQQLKLNTDRGFIGYLYKGYLIEYYDETIHGEVIKDAKLEPIFGLVVLPVTVGIVVDESKVYFSPKEFASTLGVKDPSCTADWVSRKARQNLSAFGYQLRVATLEEINSELVRRISSYKNKD